MTTDLDPWDYSILAFAGQMVEDLALLETSNHTVLPPGHNELPSIGDAVVQQIGFEDWVEQFDYSICA
jgi:hypothetical protein